MDEAVDLALVSDELEALRSALRHGRDELAKRDELIAHLNQRLEHLQAQINLLVSRRFGSSSERVSDAQLGLFNEAEALVEGESVPEEEASEAAPTQVPAHERRRPKRKALPDELTRVEVHHELPDGERHCAEHGVELERFGEQVSEQLDIIPATVRVIRHVRGKYRCPCCTAHLVTAPMPPQPIPKSLASPGLLAHIAVAKYVDGLPLYRQERQFERIDVHLWRSTQASWRVRCGELAQPLINLLRETLLEQPYIQMDETTVQVLDEAGKAAQSKSYLWVQQSIGEVPIILFDYDASRSKAIPLQLLEGFTGALHTDGYRAYDAASKRYQLTRLFCMTHARRKFTDIIKSAGVNLKKIPPKPPPEVRQALQALEYFKTLYIIEGRIKDKPPDERHAQRQQYALPVLDKLRKWMDKKINSVLPSSAMGIALAYLSRHWDGLVRYCEDGRYNIDTNPVENAIRPFCVGRRNWLFHQSVAGAKASANLYSLVETARANNLEPYAYLRKVFTELPQATSIDDIEALLPGNIDPHDLKSNS